jgi:hypothetical protein
MYLRIGSSCGVVAGTLGGERSTRRKMGSSSGCGAGPGGGRRGSRAPLDGLTGAVDSSRVAGGPAANDDVDGSAAGLVNDGVVGVVGCAGTGDPARKDPVVGSAVEKPL